MQEERADKTRAWAVSCRQMRHRLFLVKRRDRGPLRVMQTHHLKVSKNKTTWPNHMDKKIQKIQENAHVAKRYARNKGESNQVSTR
jgi:hypothetical protein